jgi:hypothetical protein
MKEIKKKLATIAKLAGEILQNKNSDTITKTVAGNIHQSAMVERGRIITNERSNHGQIK